ncbi:MAG: CpaF family protein [Candidatus ainarchaeum sp.]|nr:CpaF family protein [Candidatus ainarchaeum sp.]
MASYIDELKAQINKTKETKAEEFKKSEKKELDLSAPQSFKNTNNSISENKSSDDFLELDSLKDAFTKTNQSQKSKPIVETTKIEEPIVSKENQEFEESVKETINKSISASKINLAENANKENKNDFEKDWDEKSHLVTKYGIVEIYRVDNQALYHYKIPTPKPTASQKLIINTLKEAATRLITIDPYKIRDPLQRQNIYYQKILDILENAPEINVPKHMFDFYAGAVVKEMVGFGQIEPLLQDDKLEEIMIIGPNKPTYVYHRDYGMMTTNVVFYSDDGVLEIIDKIARILGRRVDISNPLLDARLPDGSRVNATIHPASIDGATITIRKFRADPYTIVDLIKFSTLNLEVAAFLWCIVDGFGAKPANIVISGGTGSGKTTLLNVLANFIPDSNRVLTIEDTAELKLPIKQVIRFEGRPPGLEGKGELTLDILVKNSLRMRPDRVIVGEIRHTEALSLFTAMNTGHDGCMGTIHANSARETLVRITSPPMEVPLMMLAGLDFIIVEKRLNTSKGMVRRIVNIAEISGILDNDPKADIIFKWNPTTDNLERTDVPIKFFEMIKTYTNLTDNDIKSILTKRINILNDLVNKNIGVLEEVSKMIQHEYINQKS